MKLVIDGAAGEGGGQILRTALGLSLVTGTPFEMHSIRAGRRRPGLLRQHLTAVEAAARIGEAKVKGARLSSRTLSFEPDGIDPGIYTFDVESAGSATLVLQTILFPLMRAGGPSEVTLRGGTHNPHAPPFEFVAEIFLPLLRRMGADVEARLVRRGFHPKGGGEIHVTIRPAPLKPLELLERERIRRRRATAVVADLPRHVADRELAVVAKRLGWKKSEMKVEEVDDEGPGNVLLLQVDDVELVTGFGAPGLPAERVAQLATRELARFLKSDVPVGKHLADQLLIPIALAGGTFRTGPLSAHATTNAALIERFLPVRFEIEKDRVTAV